MTTEIAILNSTGVALAADSAVSSMGAYHTKVFNTANKLFSLSKFHPVGLMVYGNASFMGVPWETAVKVYRERLGDQCFSTLEGYWEDFKTFLEYDLLPAPEGEEFNAIKDNFIVELVGSVYWTIRSDIKSHLDALTIAEQVASQMNLQMDTVPVDNVSSFVERKVSEYVRIYQGYGLSSNTCSNDLIRRTYERVSTEINRNIQDIFDGIPISSVENDLRSIFDLTISRNFPMCSGVVIVGFGDDQIYPSILTHEVEFVAENHLKFRSLNEKSLPSINPGYSAIFPFAQTDVIDTVMSGVAPQIREVMRNNINSLSDNVPDFLSQVIPSIANQGQLLDQISSAVRGILSEHYRHVHLYTSGPYFSDMLSAASMLSIGDMAAMAEALVNITSMKHKVSTYAETVGGPIDVAVISKGDGLIWVKRKHYFEPGLNHHFFSRYYSHSRANLNSGAIPHT